jgi:hypothetical protein
MSASNASKELSSLINQSMVSTLKWASVESGAI